MDQIKVKKRFDAPDAYIVLFIMIIAAFLLTFIIPAGSFDVTEEAYIENGVDKVRKSVEPESFQYLLDEEGNPDYLTGKIFTNYYATGETGILNAMHNGFVAGGIDGTAGMIAFILIIGGAFGVVIRTGAIDMGIWSILKRLKGNDIYIIPGIMIVFSLGGAVLGLAEELIPFALIIIPLLIRLGYDGITAMCTAYCSMMIGFAATWMNPYTLLIAQGIAGVPLMSGAGLRIALYLVLEIGLFIYVMKRARKYKSNPELAITYDTDMKYFRVGHEDIAEQMDGKGFMKGHAVILLAFAAGFTWLFWGILAHGWYLPQMSGQFFGIAVVCGALGVLFKYMSVNDIALSFKQGLSDMVPVVMILALGKGLTLILGGVDNSIPSVLNTILFYAGNTLGGLPQFLTAWGMYLFQSLFNFLVTSGPAQAAIVMPIMAPLSDILGVTRQTAVLAYHMGDGFTNMINPSSAVLMAFLGIAKIDFLTWVKFQWKMQLIIFAVGSAAMIIAVAIGY
jgi:uncharacterized ion transporter superfamily protein YfcC